MTQTELLIAFEERFKLLIFGVVALSGHQTAVKIDQKKNLFVVGKSSIKMLLS